MKFPRLALPGLALLLTIASGLAATVTETYTFTVIPPNGDIEDFQDPPKAFLQTISTSQILYITKVEVRLKLVGRPTEGCETGCGFAGEMFVSLNRNFAQTAVLLNRVGVTEDNSVGAFYDGWNVTFADAAAADIHFADTEDGTGVLTGTWQPDGRTAPADTARPQMLAGFNNQRGNGDWRLAVGDLELGGVMRLESWELVLTGDTAPEIQLEQPAGTILIDGTSSISFGNVGHGTSSSAKTFTITNVGTENLTGIAVTKDGSGSSSFVLNTSSLSTTLNAGSSTTFTVTFAPSTTGARSATLHIASNDADENPFDITITGTGTNQNPVANTDTIERFPSESVKVRVSALLANDTDPDGDTPLAITGVSSAASNRATVTLSGGYVFYLPASGYTAADTFTYQVSDSFGGTATGTVMVNIKANAGQSTNITAIKMEPAAGGGMQTHVSFAGIPGRTYAIESSDSLDPADWQYRASVTANELGQIEFIDPPPLPPQRFYRTVYPAPPPQN